MRGLLLKDWYMVKKHCRAYLLIVVVFLAGSLFIDHNMFYITYPCLMSSMIPMTLLAYDEQSKWNLTALTLPYTRAQLVSVKFLVGLIAGGCVLLATGIIQAVRMCLGGSFQWDTYLSLLSTVLILCCVIPSITLPFLFWLGAEKGRIYFSIAIGGIFGVSAVVYFMLPFDSVRTVSSDGISPLLCAAAIGLYALVWRLSIVLYRKRDF